MASFSEAFRSARKSGKKEFSWNGKRYNTKLKEDSGVPTPTARPERKADTATSGASRSTSGKARPARARADYPKPSTDVGVAKAGSKISNSVAKDANRPGRDRADYPRPAKAQGISRKGSAISKAAARQENKPRKK